jgi:hypothetical protein
MKYQIANQSGKDITIGTQKVSDGVSVTVHASFVDADFISKCKKNKNGVLILEKEAEKPKQTPKPKQKTSTKESK